MSTTGYGLPFVGVLVWSRHGQRWRFGARGVRVAPFTEHGISKFTTTLAAMLQGSRFENVASHGPMLLRSSRVDTSSLYSFQAPDYLPERLAAPKAGCSTSGTVRRRNLPPS